MVENLLSVIRKGFNKTTTELYITVTAVQLYHALFQKHVTELFPYFSLSDKFTDVSTFADIVKNIV